MNLLIKKLSTYQQHFERAREVLQHKEGLQKVSKGISISFPIDTPKGALTCTTLSLFKWQRSLQKFQNGRKSLILGTIFPEMRPTMWQGSMLVWRRILLWKGREVKKPHQTMGRRQSVARVPHPCARKAIPKHTTSRASAHVLQDKVWDRERGCASTGGLSPHCKTSFQVFYFKNNELFLF